MYTKKLRSKSNKRDISTVENKDEIGLPPTKKKKECDIESVVGELNDEVFNDNVKDDCHTKLIPKSPRQPRMASLNAIAKVNAVLCDYRVERKVNVTQVQHNKKIKPITIKQKDLKSYTKTDNDKQIKHFNEFKTKSIKKEIIKISLPLKKQIGSKIKVRNSFCSVEKSTQTDVYHKSIQTEDQSTLFHSHKTLCTCPTTGQPIGISFYFPLSPTDEKTTNCPLHIKSNVLVHDINHSLAIPIIKQHHFPNTMNPVEFNDNIITSNITQLQEDCLQNLLLQYMPSTAKLIYLNSLKEEKEKLLGADKSTAFLEEDTIEMTSSSNNGNKFKKKELTVPSLNCRSISIPSAKALAVEEKQKNKNNVSKIKEKKIVSLKPQKQKKTCNGWVFEGASVQESFKQGNQMIVRKYYPSIHRQDDIIHLQDAVLLKSDHENDSADYVARILEFWEDSCGSYAGEMMMSVLWYYKPEQMRIKYTDMHFEEMELFASRHKDDNSIACILDKCFVVSYSQFCRFRSQRQLFKESRTNKLSLVPQSKKMKSRWLPSPTTSFSLVYFCRYGYDFRTGKILKQS